MGTKALVAPATIRTKTDGSDDRKGVVEAIVSVFGNVDTVGDRVLPGAFQSFVDRVNDGWKAPFVWAHQTHTPDMFIGDTLAAEETAEGLKITAQLHLDEPVAAKVYELIRKGQVANYSFAYRVEDSRRSKDGANELLRLDVSETGPCMYGANPETRTLAAKNDQGATMNQETDAAKAAQIKAPTPVPYEMMVAASTKHAQHRRTTEGQSQGATFVKAIHDTFGRKDIAPSGTVSVPVQTPDRVVEIGRDTRWVSQIIPTTGIDSPHFSYLRQTLRDNQAAPVARAALKPTSEYQVEMIPGYAPTIAHVSEPIPRQFLSDADSLGQFLEDEMTHGLWAALDHEIVAGNGTALGAGETNVTGLLVVAGTKTQAFDTDIFTTTRKALTALDAAGERPTAWVMSPADWETFELDRTIDEHFVMGGAASPVDTATRRLWGVPVVVSPSAPAGTAILGDFRNGCELKLREDVRLDWAENHGDDFTHNLVRLRVEMRAGLAIYRPPAFNKVALTGSGSA